MAQPFNRRTNDGPVSVEGYDPEAPRDYSSQEAANERAYDDKEREYYRGLGGRGAELADKWNSNAPYRNPGSADWGGWAGAVDYYRDQAAAGGRQNDAAQQGNLEAMGLARQGMTRERPDPNPENWALSKRAAATRAQQMESLGLSRDAAMGLAPSEAAFQTRLGMNDIMGQQSAQMGGARGLAGLSGAQTQGSAAAGNSASNLAATGGMARSKEISDAIGMYGTQAGTVRDQDLSRLNMSNQNSMFNARANDDWRIGNANLLAQQAQLGNAQAATDQAWMTEQQRGADKQFQYDQRMAAEEAGADADAAGAAIAGARESREHTRQLVNGGVTAGLTAVGTAFGGPIGGAGGAAAGAAFGEVTKDWDW